MNKDLASIEAEEAVLGAFLTIPAKENEETTAKNLTLVSHKLKASDFYRPEHQLLYQAIQQLREQGKPVDLVLLTKMLRHNQNLERIGGVPFLTKIANAVPTAANVMHHAKIVKNYSNRRICRQIGQKIIIQAEDDTITEEDNELYLQKALRLASQIKDDDTNDVQSVGEISQGYFERLNKRSEGEFQGVATGFAGIDQKVHGLRNGALTLLAARTRIGKSALAGNISLNAAKAGKHVLYFSLEMSKDDLMDRWCASLTGISTNDFDQKMSQNQWSRIIRAMDRLYKMPLYICDKPGLSVNDMMYRAKKMQQQYGLDLVIVDHVQIVKGDTKKLRVDDLYEIARELKGMAKLLEVPVLALSQISRGVESREDKVPTLSDLRGSGGLEENADNVWILHRPNPKDPMDHTATLVIDKVRQGGSKIVPLAWMGPITTFFDMPSQEDNVQKPQTNAPYQPTIERAEEPQISMAERYEELRKHDTPLMNDNSVEREKVTKSALTEAG